MKTLNLKKLPAFVTLLLVSSVNLMAQKNAWHLFKPNGNYPNVQFSGTGYAPSLGTNFPELFKNSTTPFTNYLATNVMTDDEGKLLFTVITTLTDVFLYDINNQMVGGQSLRDNNQNPVQGSKEIAIVPVDKGVKYHIITAQNIWEYDLATFTVTHIENLSGAKITSGTTNIVHDFNVAVKLNYIDNNTEGCLAGYTCYWLVANPVGLTESVCRQTKVDFLLRSVSN